MANLETGEITVNEGKVLSALGRMERPATTKEISKITGIEELEVVHIIQELSGFGSPIFLPDGRVWDIGEQIFKKEMRFRLEYVVGRKEARWRIQD